jgi:hypothetical protein
LKKGEQLTEIAPTREGVVIAIDGEKFGELLSVEPPLFSSDYVDTYNLHNFGGMSFTVTLPYNADNERVLNYLATVPEEWDLFIRQCLEKYTKV